MADQVEIQFPLLVVPEQTTFTVTSYHRVRATKAASIPTTIEYRVDCISTQQKITDWSSVSSPAASNTIVITTTENKILDDSNRFEKKQITIRLDSGLSTQVIKQKTWKVQNLIGIDT